MSVPGSGVPSEDASSHGSNDPSGETTSNHASTPSSSQPKRWAPGAGVWLILTLMAVLVLVSQLLSDELAERFAVAGHAVSSIAVIVAVVVSTASLLFWLVFRSTYDLRFRLGVLAAVVLLPIIFKVEHSGDLLSWHVRLRWWSPDRNLALPDVEESTSVSLATESNVAASFPQFMGPNRDGYLPSVQLTTDWSQQAPELLWKQPIGAGWSGFVAIGELAITQEQRGDRELVTAYDARSGQAIWFHEEDGVRFENELGGIGPRATPTIEGSQVFAIGGLGTLVCLDLTTGELLWRRDILADVKSNLAAEAKAIPWGRSGSPLVVGQLVVVPGGGPGADSADQPIALLAYDRDTGDIVWRAGSDQISYASPMLLELSGTSMIVIANESTVCGYDPTDGRELWSHPWPGHSNSNATTSQPVRVDDQHLLLTKGYGIGGELIRLTKGDPNAGEPEWSVESQWKRANVLRTKLTSTIAVDGLGFGLNDGVLECIDVWTGESQWKKGRYGHGQILVVGDSLVVLSEEGELFQIPAEITKPPSVDGIAALKGITWNTICLSGEYLLVRNSTEAACFRVPIEDRQAEPEPDDSIPMPGQPNAAGAGRR